MSTGLKLPTYADIEALPEGMTGEILAGELVVSPRPAARHARSGNVLAHCLGGPFDIDDDGPGGWWILSEPELHLDADALYPVVVPDLAGWHRHRLDSLEDIVAFTVVPDWICEILSPSTALRDRKQKLPFYGRAGVRHVWLVDPTLRTLEVFRFETGAWRVVSIFSGDDRVRAEPFDAVELALGKLWPPPPAA